MVDKNGILIEDYIVKAIRFNGCISDAIDVLVDVSYFFGRKDFKILTLK